MGLTIHYNGIFNKKASLYEMIEEVKDISEIYNWQYTIYEKQFPAGSLENDSFNDDIYGISFTPPDCETVSLCFLSNGRISSPAHLKYFGNAIDESEKKYLYMLSTKTQFAGSNCHKLIVHFLKYISKKYLKEFNVIDEGKYWETGDEKLLEKTFKSYNNFLDSVGFALDNIPLEANETFEEYFTRILKLILKSNKK
ncbi:MAG: hypothetical protein WCE54_12755 [Ignavibacteriaceae bacterium]